MAHIHPARFLIALLLFISRAATANPVVHHNITVVLYPEEGRIEAEDTIRLPVAEPAAKKDLIFALHAGLTPRPTDPAVTLKRRRAGNQEGQPEQFSLQVPPGRDSVTLRYGGPISRPLLPQVHGQAVGPVSPAGAYLSGASYWYPVFGDEYVTFTLAARLPEGWHSMSQGTRTKRETLPGGATEHWSERHPQEDIQLVAARLHEYQDESKTIRAMALLRNPDRALAMRYMDATHRYLAFYSRLLGPYPYEKFALVENFWDSGFGMPSFTLLGPRIIRFPFILHTSYPHEILHNWWGNGVYPDRTGNWAEGLTAYLADHLLREQRGEGASYRRAALQRYTDYVNAERDFPLTEFLARHSNATQAVGYDKSLMFFHMLRRRLGDGVFLAGLRQFYQDRLFQRSGFSDLRRALEAASGKNLQREFRQWTEQPGAPMLSVNNVRASRETGGYRLSAVLEQTQPEPAYLLEIPVAVQLEGQKQAWQTTVRMERKRLDLNLELPARPWRLFVDPEFDVMRRLARREIPPALSQILGAERVLVVLPATAPSELRKAYQAIARSWAASNDAIQATWDTEITQLPTGQAVWLFGWENHHRSQLAAALAPQHVTITDSGVTLDKRMLSRDENGMVLVARHPGNAELPIAWLAYDRAEGLPGLARKIPHYGTYSCLAFTGNAPDNVLKEQWPVTDSPLWTTVIQSDGAAAPDSRPSFAPRTPLGQPPHKQAEADKPERGGTRFH